MRAAAPFFPSPLLAVALALLLAGCAVPGSDEGPRLPSGVAVIGDSISRATNVAGDSFGDQPVHSWATGSAADDGVESHFERLRALDPALDIVPFNDARAGARVSDMRAQAEDAVQQRAEYVLVLLGANDACAGTPASEFRGALELGADMLAQLDAEVLVASVPDVTQLVALFGENETARAIWKAYDVCPRILTEGVDLAPARDLIAAYNDALREEAAERGWRWDGGAVHDIAYRPEDVSAVDVFHPSLVGQARLAEVTWAASPYAAWPPT